VATSSISGLSSGLDTATIIDQLMQLESASQTKLKTRQTTENSILAALRAINTDTAALATKAATLAKPATWQAMQGTVTGTGVSVTTEGTASATSFSYTVESLAVSHQIGFTSSAALTDVVAQSQVTITGSDGVPHDIDAGGGTLKELADAINASSATTGVKATTVRVADGSYRLLAESTATGTATAFTLTNGDGSALLGGAAVRAGADARIALGVGITATSTTNTFEDLVPGLDLTLGATTTVGTTGTVAIAPNTTSLSSSVSDLVDQVNSLLSTLDKATANKATSGTAGILYGESVARDLRNSLVNTVFGGSTGSMAAYGIQTDRSGKLVFDADAFQKAYNADPAAVAAKFTSGATTAADGWAARVATVTTAASKYATGTLTSAINGHTSTVTALSKSISDWDTRLELRRTSLERQYTALETALSNLNSQGTWLAGQISSLPSWDS